MFFNKFYADHVHIIWYESIDLMGSRQSLSSYCIAPIGNRKRPGLIWQHFCFQNSHRTWSIRKGVLRNFAKFTGKLVCQSLGFNKVAGWNLQLYFKKTLAQVLSCEFCEISKNSFFTKHLQATAFLFPLDCNM